MPSIAKGVDIRSLKPQELFRIACWRVCPDFQVDDPSLLNEIFLYLINRSSVFDSMKGLWLCGNIGTGKSTMLKICREFKMLYSKANGCSGGFLITSASKVVTEYSMQGIQGINRYVSSDKPISVAFDELGREPIPGKYFGTEMNVMQFIFQMRYEQRSDAKTYVSTNMLKGAIPEVYGRYIADRVKEMFNIIELNGESRRL